MPQPLTQQDQSIRDSEPIYRHQLHQNSWRVGVRTGQGKAEDSRHDGEAPVAGDDEGVGSDGEAADDHATCVGLGHVDPRLVTSPA